MRLPIRVVLFDLGNTLMYDDRGAWPRIYHLADEALWDSLHAAGLQSKPETLYDGHKSLLQYYNALRREDLEEPGTARVLRDLLAKQKEPVPEARFDEALRAMYAITQTNWHVEEDAVPTLQTLLKPGLRLGALSNSANAQNTQELLDRGSLLPYFEFVLTSAAFGKRKPHPGIFRAALDHFHVPPEQTVMVGDDYGADILGAHQVGIHTVWITRRVLQGPAAMPIRPDSTVAALGEIPGLLP